MLGYVSQGHIDSGLVEILGQFETLYPYLALIASQNGIADPYDRRVVEAYWIGNSLLTNVKPRAFATHLTDTLSLRKKMPTVALTRIVDAVTQGVPHHTIHVMDIFIRTGHAAITHTLSTMDNCRIGWGRVVGDANRKSLTVKRDFENKYIIETQPLKYIDEKLTLGTLVKKNVFAIGITPSVGDWVSVHWGYVCGILSMRQIKYLTTYTDMAIRLANTLL